MVPESGRGASDTVRPLPPTRAPGRTACARNSLLLALSGAPRLVEVEALEDGPAGIGRVLCMLVRLEVQILPAHRAETGAVGTAQDLIREGEGNLVARPRADVELTVRDVLAAQLVVRAGIGRLVLLRRDLDEQARVGQAPHAGALDPGREREPEEVARRGTLNEKRGLRLGRFEAVGLATEDERLHREPERLVVLVAGPEAKASDGEPAHPASVAPVRGVGR